MTYYFFDTSAVAKYYIRETGSKWVRKIIQSNPTMLVISQLAMVEMVALTARRQKALTLTKDSAHRVRSQLKADFNQRQYMIVDLSKEVIEKSSALARTYSLRALDAIQLGCAVIIRAKLGAIVFIASDKELLAAAQTEKFMIDDPLLHP